jgi:hypothetical protein
MKTRLEPHLPGRPGIGGLRKEATGRVEEPGAGLQMVATLKAAVLAQSDWMRLRPVQEQVLAQALGAFGDQRPDRRSLSVPIPAPQDPCTESAQPAVQRGRVRMSGPHAPHGLPQAGRRTICGGIRRARGFDDRPRVALVGRDLNGQNAATLFADGTDALRYWRLAILNAATARPTRPARQPATGPDQRANGATRRTRNLLADGFAFDSRSLQGIICDGDGSWDSTLSGSPRGTGVCAPVPHFFQKARTLSLQRLPRKQVVHNGALMSMSFSTFASENPEPVRRECQRA